MKLRDIIIRLEKAYCGTISSETTMLRNRDEQNFLRHKFETEWPEYNPSKDTKINVYEQVAWAVLFEEFLQTKFTTAKRFGLEGLESFIAGMRTLVRHSGELGVKHFNIGMAHRGRLNVLANVLRKPISQIIGEFQGNFVQEDGMSSGDVKYHLGTKLKRVYGDGLEIEMVN